MIALESQMGQEGKKPKRLRLFSNHQVFIQYTLQHEFIWLKFNKT